VELAGYYGSDAEDMTIEEMEDAIPIEDTEEHPVWPPAPDPKPESGSVSSSWYIITI
jgi:hypothetical protein